MPVRSLNSAVLTWPTPSEVVPELGRWAEQVARSNDRVVGVALFGSYARGNWGVGSDADVLIEVTEIDRPRHERARCFPDPQARVPVDVVVFTTTELDNMRKSGARFSRVIDTEAQWLFRRELAQ